LEAAGMRGWAYDWFKSYLGERFHYVELNGRKSEMARATNGVPQGSNLGPILFSIYINDINRMKLHGSLTLFADDINLFYVGDSPEGLIISMKEDLLQIQRWLDVNRLFMNTKKTNYVLFRKPNTMLPEDLVLSLNSGVLERMRCARFLGLFIDEYLCWDDHINFVMKKISPIVGIMFRLRNVLDFSPLKTIYYGLIQSNLQYMILIWSTATQSLLAPLETLQNKVVKIILKAPLLTPTDRIYQVSKILRIRELANYVAAGFGFSILHGFMKSQTIFVRNLTVHSHGTRSISKLYLRPFKTTKYGKNGVYNQICQAYNSLTDDLLQSRSLSHFKNQFKKKISSLLETKCEDNCL